MIRRFYPLRALGHAGVGYVVLVAVVAFFWIMLAMTIAGVDATVIGWVGFGYLSAAVGLGFWRRRVRRLPRGIAGAVAATSTLARGGVEPATMAKMHGDIMPPCPEHAPSDADKLAPPGHVRLLLQQWEESEREEGWGVTVRPAGFSVHRTPEAWEAFMRDYWHAMPDTQNSRAPDLYERGCGDPIAVTVSNDHPLVLALAGRDSQRLYSWDDGTGQACRAAESIWHEAAPNCGWHVDRDWPKRNDAENKNE